MTTLSSSSFLDFCILCGTDASPRIPSIGPNRAYKLIQKFGSIEAILAQDKYRDKIEDIEGFKKMVSNAREVFGKAPPIPEGPSLEQGVYDEKEVEDWLKDVHGVMFVNPEEMAENAEVEKPQEWAVDLGQETARVEEWDETWDRAVVDESTSTSSESWSTR
jgi:5'-3' exonuclease